MKQNGMMNRIIAAALLLVMALSLLPAGGAAESAASHGYLVINNTSVNRVVNFRRQANTDDNSNYPIARLPEYWVVEILGQQKGWYHIRANINTQGGAPNYQTGYVMDSFVKVMTAQEETAWLQNQTATYRPGATAAPAAPTAVPASPTQTPASQAPAGSVLGYVRTVRPDVNMRNTPGGSVINENDKIALGIVLPYFSIIAYEEYDWALVQYNGKTGYIRSDCYMKSDAAGVILTGDTTPSVTIVPTAAPTVNPNTGVLPGQTYGRVTVDNVFFRKSMSTAGDSWAKLPAGWTMEVLGVYTQGGVTWYKVKGSIPSNRSRTYTGYIHGNFFTLVEAATAQAVTAAPTVPPAATDYALITVDGINLRQTPGGSTVTVLRVNAVVNVLSAPAGNTANDWYYIECAGVYGYLPATALRVLSTAELGSYVLPAKPNATVSPTATAAAVTSGYIKLVKDKVNIRKTPAGTVLTPKESDKLPVGTVLAYTEGPVSNSNYAWVKVTWNGITGYVRGDCFVYCDANGNAAATPAPGAPTAAPAAPTAAPGLNTPDPTDTPSGSTTTQGYIKLNRGGVNLRVSVWGTSLGQLDKGTVLPYFNIVKNSSNSTEVWYEVYSSKYGSFGFILGTMAELCDAQGGAVSPGVLPTASPVTIVGYVATSASSVWLRMTPSAGADTNGQVKAKGTVLPMIGPAVITDYAWYPVQTADGKRGYLRGDYVFELADWQLDLYNQTGKLATPTPGPATPRPGNSDYLQVVGGSLWIRETPSRKADTVGQLADRAVIKYLKKQTVSNVTWYQVTYNGKTGWVMGTYVRVLTNAEYDAWKGTASPAPTVAPTAANTTPDASQYSDMAMTTADRVNIRASASMSGKELTMVYKTGTVLTYLGKYNAPTQNNPYYWYNVKYQGVTGWMRGEFIRVLTTAEKAAYQQSGNPDSPQQATYRTLSKNSSGDDVRKLQQKLVELGYLAADQVSGQYLTSTENAVIAFQRAKGLTVDGIAGSKTQHALFGTVESGTQLDNNGSSVSVTLYPVEKSDWYTGDIQRVWTVGAVAIITDVYTGISFKAQRLYGDNHADCEPLTTADTAAYCRIYGVTTPQDIEDREQELQSYRRRPLWVTIGGRTFAASMYGIPHNYSGDRIADNGYNGQFCVHFTNSKTHTTNIVDPDASYNNYFGHQSAINYAYSHSISGTK